LNPSHLYKTGYTIQSKTETPDAGGAVVSSWSNTYTDVFGHIRTASQNEITAQYVTGAATQGDRLKDEVIGDHVFYTDVKYTITNKDRIKDPDGQIYSVATVKNPHGLDAFLQVLCRRSDFERESDA